MVGNDAVNVTRNEAFQPVTNCDICNFGTIGKRNKKCSQTCSVTPIFRHTMVLTFQSFPVTWILDELITFISLVLFLHLHHTSYNMERNMPTFVKTYYIHGRILQTPLFLRNGKNH